MDLWLLVFGDDETRRAVFSQDLFLGLCWRWYEALGFWLGLRGYLGLRGNIGMCLIWKEGLRFGLGLRRDSGLHLPLGFREQLGLPWRSLRINVNVRLRVRNEVCLRFGLCLWWCWRAVGLCLRSSVGWCVDLRVLRWFWLRLRRRVGLGLLEVSESV